MPKTNKIYVFRTASGPEDNRYMTAYKISQFNGKPYYIREKFNVIDETLNNLDFVHREMQIQNKYTKT
jgi:hypothetical protein